MLTWNLPGPQGKGSVPSWHRLRARKQGWRNRLRGCWSIGCGHAWWRIQILICGQSGVSSTALALSQGLLSLNIHCVPAPILTVITAVFIERSPGTRALLLGRGFCYLLLTVIQEERCSHLCL